ncbi:MAG: DUF2142 domain-containing protein, partial [Solirubrobacteraceae bacterium]|nr:DUF2142 domain-containing protein [Solirubrobacteraceae bacterium]
ALLSILAAWVLAIRVASTVMRREDSVSRATALRVGVVGTLFATAFALTTPPFMAADEPVHLQYTQLLESRQALPQTVEQRGDVTSAQAQLLLGAAATSLVQFSPDRRTPWGYPEDRALDQQLDRLPSGDAQDSFTNASSQPPAYYVGGALVQAGSGGSVLDRILVLRLYSALLFGLAVAGTVMFAREAVPRARGLAVAGGIMLAALPIAAFVGGSINPDALLAAASAWTLAVLARILRRGVTMRRSLALGALVGLGLLSKLTFAALLPAIALSAAVVIYRGWRRHELRDALLCTAAAAGLAVLIAAPYFGWAALSGRGVVFGPPGPPAPATSLRETLTYAIDLYVGAFGPIQDRIEGSGPWQIWLGGLTGRLGWLDFGVPDAWVRRIAVVWGALFVLAVAGVLRSARARRAIPVDAVVYGLAAASLMFVIAQAGLTARLGGTPGFEQARYLLPIAALGVGGVALALRQLPGTRVRDWAAAGVVVFGLVNGTAAYLITVGRYFA